MFQRSQQNFNNDHSIITTCCGDTKDDINRKAVCNDKDEHSIIFLVLTNSNAISQMLPMSCFWF